jgi:hypothetical protein
VEDATMSLEVISYGGGVQSTALLVLAAQGQIAPRLALFSNVGDDSEDPLTVQYVREVAIPWGAAHGVEVQELRRIKRDGTTETLWGRLMREGSRSLPIPIRMSNGAPNTRSCTVDFKVQVIAKALKRLGATAADPARVHVGISWDEIERMGRKKEAAWEQVVYPLIDLRLTREDCKRIIERAGLPVPPKSSCFFCPFHRPSAWAAMRRDRPELFEKSAHLEDVLNVRRQSLGRDPVWLTRFNRPLREAIPEGQPLLAFDPGAGPGETCDEGYCWT